MAIRAAAESVPEDLLEFFRLHDSDKDPEGFWKELKWWYQDQDTGEWLARWEDFYFPGYADFGLATFTGDAVFSKATFTGDAFFSQATFTGAADFMEATFTGYADFGGATFTGHADFFQATFSRRALFSQTVIESSLFLGMSVLGVGEVVIEEAGQRPTEREGPGLPAETSELPIPTGAPLIELGEVSVARVAFRNIDASQIRFIYATDINKLSLSGRISWHTRKRGPGYRVADEDDLEALARDERPRRAPEVERIYTALRKNYEDRNDRVGAHGWYWAEMEIGRRYPSNRLTWLARSFYRWTSDYGLSALRPLFWLAGIALVAFLLYMIPWRGICPVTADGCSGWEGSLKVVLLGAFFQPPPTGVTLTGVLANIVWLLVRVLGAAMLLSIGLAFRNQVAR